jgi:serine/threonine protein kinase
MQEQTQHSLKKSPIAISVRSIKSQSSNHPSLFVETPEQFLDSSANSHSKLDDYEEVKPIYAGEFDSVYLYKRKSDNSLFYLKFISLIQSGVENISNLESEAKLLLKLNHPNISKYVDYFTHKDNFIIVMEYVKGETLRQKIKIAQKQNKHFSEEFICLLFSQLISALSYCHSLLIIHRDIKSESIIITNENIVKFIDFRFAKQVESSKQNV